MSNAAHMHPDDWRGIAEDKIQEAMDEGKFDNLKGAGKPFDWGDENPYEDPGMRPAYDLLKANGFSLPWIEEGKDIDAEIDRITGYLINARRNYNDMQLAPEWWKERVEKFREKAEAVNSRIRSLNIIVPQAAFQRRLFDYEDIITQLEND